MTKLTLELKINKLFDRAQKDEDDKRSRGNRTNPRQIPRKLVLRPGQPLAQEIHRQHCRKNDSHDQIKIFLEG